MKTQFKTISIGSLVLSYLGLMAICFLLMLILNIIAPALLLLILPVVLYFLFRGEVELRTAGDNLLVTWIKKPFLRSQKDFVVNLNEIIRWKHQSGYRGPDSFTVILKDGKQLEFRPDMFSLRDWHSELWVEFDNEMREFHSNTSKKELYTQIVHSGYIKKLNNRIKLVKYMNYFLITLGLLSLILMIPFGAYETALSIVFLSVFVLLAGWTIYYHYLKNERKESLKRW